MEKQNSQLEHGQPMEQTRGLFCTCDSGVARCQSQHQYHFWRISSTFEAYCTASELGSCQSNVCNSLSFIKGLLRKFKYIIILIVLNNRKTP